MKTIELFSGTKSFSRVMAAHKNNTFTVDSSTEFKPDLLRDIADMDADELPYRADILWASPPCTAFSVASIGKHWGGGYRKYEPKTESAKQGLYLLTRTMFLISEARPTWWFIENPRGVMRKVFPNLPAIRHTITYCQYGDDRMKPTDIWTNAAWWKPRAACKNGATCHVRAPRGSRTGTQGIKGHMNRGVIPAALFEEILEQMPKP